jgi:hypothetical protein
MTQSLTVSQRIQQLRTLNIQLRRQLEVAEAQVPVINDLLKQLDTIQLGCKRAFLDPVIYQRLYDRGYGPEDSCQVIQATAVAGHGLGVTLWDIDEYQAFCKRPWLDDHTVLVHFVAFDDLESSIKALLMPQVEPLLNRICQQILPPVVNQASPPVDHSRP